MLHVSSLGEPMFLQQEISMMQVGAHSSTTVQKMFFPLRFYFDIENNLME
jgi:hypothetical protein